MCFPQWGFHKWDSPKSMVYFMENPLRLDDLRLPPFPETPISIHKSLSSMNMTRTFKLCCPLRGFSTSRRRAICCFVVCILFGTQRVFQPVPSKNSDKLAWCIARLARNSGWYSTYIYTVSCSFDGFLNQQKRGFQLVMGVSKNAWFISWNIPSFEMDDDESVPQERLQRRSDFALWDGAVVKTDWWFGTFFIFPYIGNNHPNWLIFFRGVQTTNQKISGYLWVTPGGLVDLHLHHD